MLITQEVKFVERRDLSVATDQWILIPDDVRSNAGTLKRIFVVLLRARTNWSYELVPWRRVFVVSE